MITCFCVHLTIENEHYSMLLYALLGQHRYNIILICLIDIEMYIINIMGKIYCHDVINEL